MGTCLSLLPACSRVLWQLDLPVMTSLAMAVAHSCRKFQMSPMDQPVLLDFFRVLITGFVQNLASLPGQPLADLVLSMVVARVSLQQPFEQAVASQLRARGDSLPSTTVLQLLKEFAWARSPLYAATSPALLLRAASCIEEFSQPEFVLLSQIAGAQVGMDTTTLGRAEVAFLCTMIGSQTHTPEQVRTIVAHFRAAVVKPSGTPSSTAFHSSSDTGSPCGSDCDSPDRRSISKNRSERFESVGSTPVTDQLSVKNTFFEPIDEGMTADKGKKLESPPALDIVMKKLTVEELRACRFRYQQQGVW